MHEYGFSVDHVIQQTLAVIKQHKKPDSVRKKEK